MIDNQVINGIKYAFDGWSDGSSSSTLAHIPVIDRTFTANFHADTPVKVTGFQYVYNVGQPIEFNWNEHPNSNVKYRNYRKIKFVQGENLIATLNHGTTSFTDWNYVQTSGYTQYLMEYDARAYYTPTGN